MAQEKVTVDSILRLVQTLTSDERAELQRRLDTSNWGEQWDRLSAKVRARFHSVRESIPSEEEVMAEIKEVRKERDAKRAQVRT